MRYSLITILASAALYACSPGTIEGGPSEDTDAGVPTAHHHEHGDAGSTSVSDDAGSIDDRISTDDAGSVEPTPLGDCQVIAGTPPAPTELGVVPHEDGAHLFWTNNSTQDEEYVVRRKEAGGEWMEAGIVGGGWTSLHNAPLPIGVEFTYYVTSRNSAGESCPSNQVVFTRTE